MADGHCLATGGSRLRTEGADIYSAWVNDRRAGLRHSLMGNDFSAPPGIEHWSPTLSHLTLLRPWRRSWCGWYSHKRNGMKAWGVEQVLHVSPGCRLFLAPFDWRCAAGEAVFVRHTQARRPRHQTRKYKMSLCLFIVGCLHHTFSFIVQMAG